MHASRPPTQVLRLMVLLLTAGASAAGNLSPPQAAGTGAPQASKRITARTEQELIADLKSANDRTRLIAACELGRRKSQAAIGPLADLLSDRTESVRQITASSLLDMGDVRALPVLRAFVESATPDNPSYGLTAGLSLAKHGYEDGVALAPACLTSRSPIARSDAVAILGRCRDEDTAIGALWTGVRDSERSVRLSAAHRLRERASLRCLELLQVLMRDQDELVRLVAVGATAATGFSDAIPLLIDVLDAPSMPVVRSAVRHLNQLTGRQTKVPVDPASVGALKRDWEQWWAEKKSRFPVGERIPTTP